MKIIKRMYDHVNWANRRINETLNSFEEDTTEQRRLFAHILLAERVWLTRIHGNDSSNLAIWNDLTVDECKALAEQNEKDYAALLDSMKDSDLEKIIHYKNSKGETFQTSLGDILTHVALHGHYHRGQINALHRRGGLEPVNTDYITFVR
ncbi:DinB family protein [Bacillus sp. Marseille-P3661]|uniref:DinB family protein n=1 Tax=Bacillus sp. Marseille-P3661 TaxID=1936234 RepID=UPI000C814F97|nr:DinB family protein [Bacillus sp. Marseille-P3661]